MTKQLNVLKIKFQILKKKMDGYDIFMKSETNINNNWITKIDSKKVELIALQITILHK